MLSPLGYLERQLRRAKQRRAWKKQRIKNAKLLLDNIEDFTYTSPVRLAAVQGPIRERCDGRRSHWSDRYS